MLRNFISIAITSKEIDTNRPSNSQILISKESNGIHNNNDSNKNNNDSNHKSNDNNNYNSSTNSSNSIIAIIAVTIIKRVFPNGGTGRIPH